MDFGRIKQADGGKAPRRRRVQRLKKLILGTIAALILIPTVLSVVLAVQMVRLQSRVDVLAESVAVLTQLLEDEEAAASRSVTETERSEVRTDTVGSSGKQTFAWEIVPEQADGEDADAAAEDADTAADEPADYAHKVYLTFDDGPSTYTDEILDVLAEHDVKATFFVVGKDDEHSREMLRRIVDEGHTLGMHSYSHKYAELYASEESFLEDLERLQSYLYDVTGVESVYYRFPGGSSNTVSRVDMSVLAEDLEEAGITYFDWNIASGDGTSSSLDADTLVRNATEKIAEHETAIILMHDSADKKTTLEALPRIIETIQAMEDTAILPITEDTEPIHHIEPEKE